MIFFAMILVVMGIIGCENDPEEIGLNIQPENELLNVAYEDSTTVQAYSEIVDSVRTDETSRNLLGSYLDPVFGLTTASIATQVRLSTTSVGFGDSPQLDSIVLAFEYTRIQLQGDKEILAYGDTTTPQTFRVYELDESIFFDSAYYSNNVPAIKEPEIGILTTAPTPTDSITVDTLRLKSQLRIHLSEELGNRLLEQDSITSNEALDDLLKGFYVSPDPVSAGGAIVFFNLLETYSRLTIYYSNTESDSLEYHFNINTESARFNNYTHNYDLADPDFLAQMQGDTLLGKERLYLQSMGGVTTKIMFPNFSDWKKEEIALNEANLIFTNLNQESEFEPPSNLVLFRINSEGNNEFLQDQFEGEDYFGGEYDEATGTYTFRITQHLQKVLGSDTLTNNLLLSISGASLLPNRVVLAGYDTTLQNRLRLQLIYTKLAN